MRDKREPFELSATEALHSIATDELTSVAWIESCRERIDAREPDIQAWSYLNPDAVAQTTTRVDQGHGPSIPVGVKDIIDVYGMPTMMGTDFHDDTPVSREGGSVAIMRAAGCLFMGKTVTTELGHRHPGPTRNPHNLAHTPGGSSSGSAAAVADFMVPLCLGTQTTASVIRPAAFCGIVGYKPTYGDFDKSGILANAPTMDTLGIMARSIDDLGLLRSILLEEARREVTGVSLSDINFALLNVHPWNTAEAETQRVIEALADDMVRAGARPVDLAIGDQVKRLIELHRLISGYEFGRSIAYERTRHLNQLSTVLREGRLADGREVDSRRYPDLIREVAALRATLAEALKVVDIMISPSAAGPAPASLESTGDAAFSAAWSLAGNPVITLPLFKAADTAMPIGCQLIAGFGEDERLLNVSQAIMARFQ